jgi:5'-nucleotidase
MPLVLVTNDDGVHAPGIKALHDAMLRVGRPVIIAPDRDSSAASHSLTMNRPLKVSRLAENIYSIDGTPTDCVTIGINKVLTERPALVVSGINPGGNLGDDISYSGTVSAAIEATMLGIPAIALSMAGEQPFHFDIGAEIGARLADEVLSRGLPPDTLLNINIPNVGRQEIAGIRFTRQGRRKYDDSIKETQDPWGRTHYWIGGGTPYWDNGPDSDSTAVAARYISITPIHLDLTNYEALDTLQKKWRELLK